MTVAQDRPTAQLAAPAAPYRGRFAPSPTGELHFGSLVAALGSWLDARAVGGEWLLRIEDVDTPRVVRGADAAICRRLEEVGLIWDGAVLYQSQRREAYRAAIEALRQGGDIYRCTCSRKEIAALASRRARDGAWVYPGTCRDRDAPTSGARGAVRLRVGDALVGFVDRLQAPLSEALASEVGDFVLRRADGLFTYQLAVVVDDAAQAISHVVRGADLIDSTPRQIFLQQRLGLPRPSYLHLPVAVDAAGQKLSKQTRAPALGARAIADELAAALGFLGHPPPAGLCGAPPGELLAWARTAWNPRCIPACLRQQAPAAACA